VTIPGVFTHINLLHSALLWAAIRPFPLHSYSCTGPILGLMGQEGVSVKQEMGGWCSSAPRWRWPAAWKAWAHPSWRPLSSTPRRTDLGFEPISRVCEQKCSLYVGVVRSRLIAVIITLAIPVEREWGIVLCWLVIVCEKVQRQGRWYLPALKRWDSIFPACKSVCLCV